MKTYWLRFGFGDPRNFAGLSPTLLRFTDDTGVAITKPAITEVFDIVGGVTTSTGYYKFIWGTTTPIAFLADAATTSPGPQGRYVAGSLDPVDRVDEGITITVGGLGSTTSSFGDSTTDPVDLFGYMKRIVEHFEGNSTFGKTTGVLTLQSRGSSTTLRTKTITNSVSLVTKT